MQIGLTAMSKILVHLTHGPEEPKQAEMAFTLAKNAMDGGHIVTVLLSEKFLPLVHDGAANIASEVCQRSLREYFTALVRQGAKIEVSGPPLEPATSQAVPFKPLPGFAVSEALLRLSAGQDRIFTY